MGLCHGALGPFRDRSGERLSSILEASGGFKAPTQPGPSGRVPWALLDARLVHLQCDRAEVGALGELVGLPFKFGCVCRIRLM